MDSRMVLCMMTAVAGFTMVVGGMWLIYKQKIYIDRESNQPIEIQLPGNFSFKSNYPALALFVLGFVPLIYPFHELTSLRGYVLVKNVKITGVAHSDEYPALVYAAYDPSAVIKDGDDFVVPVPVVHKDDRYKVLLIVNGHVLDSQTAAASASANGEIAVQFKSVVVDPPKYQGQIAAVPAAYQ